MQAGPLRVASHIRHSLGRPQESIGAKVFVGKAVTEALHGPSVLKEGCDGGPSSRKKKLFSTCAQAARGTSDTEGWGEGWGDTEGWGEGLGLGEWVGWGWGGVGWGEGWGDNFIVATFRELHYRAPFLQAKLRRA
jgi:hypothetical protein